MRQDPGAFNSRYAVCLCGVTRVDSTVRGPVAGVQVPKTIQSGYRSCGTRLGFAAAEVGGAPTVDNGSSVLAPFAATERRRFGVPPADVRTARDAPAVNSMMTAGHLKATWMM